MTAVQQPKSFVSRVKNKVTHGTQDAIFKRVHNSRLIYNACWEDPRIDRELLNIDQKSKIVVISSAGCNVLDYLLDHPASIDAIDVNPRQNALLALKIALIQHRPFDDLFAMFAEGKHADYKAVYADVRPHLPTYAQSFWDKKIGYFSPRSWRKSFYFYSTSGDVAWFFTLFMRSQKSMWAHIQRLLDAKTLEEQREIYDEIEPQIWSKLVSWIVKRPMMTTLLGVPRPQVQLITQEYETGMLGFLRHSFRHLFTEVPIHDNYFWRAYITGSYTETCCPNYLKKPHFATLQENVSRVTHHTKTISEFLQQNPDKYTHFILLDHQDWLAWHMPEALQEEWDLILANSQAGTKILLRSAAPTLDFVPANVQDALHFSPEITEPIHQTDRVGTYSSLHLAEVQ
ncbi:MAG TPA: DUF3419 family protein [Thiothrix sp.]|nr:DUF3419 family protein [Thiothrix sp.]